MELKRAVIAVAIALLTIFVCIYGMNTFYPQPKYDTFCNNTYNGPINNSADCASLGGKWMYPQYAYEKNLAAPAGEQGYCDMYSKCSEEYNGAHDDWVRTIFIIGLPLGIIFILMGAFIFALDFVGAGLMWGGVFTIVVSSWMYFWDSSDIVRFIMSLIGLIILIYMGYHFARKSTVKELKGKKRK